jgi:hypothetical protein
MSNFKKYLDEGIKVDPKMDGGYELSEKAKILIGSIDKRINTFAKNWKNFKRGNLTWGHIGNMGKVDELLKELEHWVK